jgi:CheY-like chemotaxis protein
MHNPPLILIVDDRPIAKFCELGCGARLPTPEAADGKKPVDHLATSSRPILLDAMMPDRRRRSVLAAKIR